MGCKSVHESRQVAIRVGVLMLTLVASHGCALRNSDRAANGSREDYVAKVREMETRARPVPARTFSPSIEANDEILASALFELEVAPGPQQHRRVAERYRELGISDLAHDHFSRARQLDPTDAEAYEGLARIWRDWGFPHLGLDDASRAVDFAPAWPVAHNTLGTILAAMGRTVDARREYTRVLTLDPRAAYALNNICYLSFLEGEIPRAIDECRAALEVDPGLTAARNNLALAYAADQRDDLALREFQAAGDPAAAAYNIGIVHMAEGRYAVASKAFDDASRDRPSWRAARARAQNTRVLAAKAGGPSQ